MSNFSKLATLGVHGDEAVVLDTTGSTDVVPPISVSTIFKYPDGADNLDEWKRKVDAGDTKFVYSRIGQPVAARAEASIGSLVGAHTVLYSSGLSAFHAAMLLYNPKRVFVGDGYHGTHGILAILHRNYKVEAKTLEEAKVPGAVRAGDVIHLETPVNPYGLAFDIEEFAGIAKAGGAKLIVDSTFAPPPLSDPLALGADLVMHSATKYFGGHSDVLAGALVTKDLEVKKQLLADRHFLGTTIASLEAWLLLRSAKTYSLRVKTQAENANKIVAHLHANKQRYPTLAKIYHSSLQSEPFVAKQLPLGGSPVFSIDLADELAAKTLPEKLKLFTHATSLGGVESLIEWRQMSDNTVGPTLLRLSIGIENVTDLINDLDQALTQPVTAPPQLAQPAVDAVVKGIGSLNTT